MIYISIMTSTSTLTVVSIYRPLHMHMVLQLKNIAPIQKKPTRPMPRARGTNSVLVSECIYMRAGKVSRAPQHVHVQTQAWRALSGRRSRPSGVDPTNVNLNSIDIMPASGVSFNLIPYSNPIAIDRYRESASASSEKK